MARIAAVAGQIWRDDCYYFDRVTGECKRKFVLVLAVDSTSGDLVTAVFTSKSHGLVEEPACFLGPPRAGYYVGVPGESLSLESWVEFSSIDTLDTGDLVIHVTSGRKRLIDQRLPDALFCAVLRCVLQSPILPADNLDGSAIRRLHWVVPDRDCSASRKRWLTLPLSPISPGHPHGPRRAS